jgi:PAS domain-containing protein
MVRARSNNGTRPSYATDLCHALAHTSPFPTAMVDGPDHVVRYVNPAFCPLVGKSAESLLGTIVADAVPECADAFRLSPR